MRRLSNLPYSLAFLLLFTACGGGGRSVDFPMPNDTPLSELTVQDMKDVCTEGAVVTQSAYSELLCNVQGIQAKFTGGDCESARASCLSMGGAGNLEDLEESCEQIDESGLERFAGCDVTVGEYESCLNSMLSMLDNFINRINCNTSLEQLQEMQFYSPEIPDECLALDARCPALDLVDDDGWG